MKSFLVLLCFLSLAFSQGIVLEALDCDGWVTVQWASGSQNKYRYRKGAHDVQLLGCGMQAAVAVDAATAAAAGGHGGEWRDQSTKRYHCSVPNMVEGALCSHSGGILQVSHWSCCGSVHLETSCKPVDCSEGSASGILDSDEVTSSELDALTKAWCPSCFTVPAAPRQEMSHAPRSFALLFRAFRSRSSHLCIRGWDTKWSLQLRLACMQTRSRFTAPRVTFCSSGGAAYLPAAGNVRAESDGIHGV
jgi:hypothetical protein